MSSTTFWQEFARWRESAWDNFCVQWTLVALTIYFVETEAARRDRGWRDVCADMIRLGRDEEAAILLAEHDALFPPLPPSPPTFTRAEIRAAYKWAEGHSADWCKGGEYPLFALRNLGGSGIGTRSVISCESCEKVKVDNRNHGDITDYEAW